jgi:hypothetical protein
MLTCDPPCAQRGSTPRRVRETPPVIPLRGGGRGQRLTYVLVRTDPTDTGGLFVGRRPGTAPIRYRTPPERGTAGRRRLDAAVAHVVLVLMVVINLLFWGPIPAGALWIASQVQYHTDSVSLGIFLGFAAMLVVLFGGLAVLKRMDGFWILARRAAGHDQRQGVLGRVFGTTAVIGACVFTFWLVFIGGLGSSLAPR